MPRRIAVNETLVEAVRLQQVLAALLRISRIQNGRHLLSLRLTDVVQLIEDLVEFYEPEAERLGIELELDAHRPLIAELDLDLVFQALSNLVDNALKHAAAGARVRIAARRRGEDIQISVADEGPGLAACDLERVTEQFYRGKSARDTPGEGLGLTMAAAIAHAHDATIAFEANDPGLKVTLTFPVTPGRGA